MRPVPKLHFCTATKLSFAVLKERFDKLGNSGSISFHAEMEVTGLMPLLCVYNHYVAWDDLSEM